jgi:hypothetical protein
LRPERMRGDGFEKKRERGLVRTRHVVTMLVTTKHKLSPWRLMMNANSTTPAPLASVLAAALAQVEAAGSAALERTRCAGDTAAMQVKEAIIDARRALTDRTAALSADLEAAREESRAKARRAMEEGTAGLVSDATLFEEVTRARASEFEDELAASVATFLGSDPVPGSDPAPVTSSLDPSDPAYWAVGGPGYEEEMEARNEATRKAMAEEAPAVTSAACGPVEPAEGTWHCPECRSEQELPLESNASGRWHCKDCLSERARLVELVAGPASAALPSLPKTPKKPRGRKSKGVNR